VRRTRALLWIALAGLGTAVAAPGAAGAADGVTLRWEPVGPKDRAAVASLRASGLVDALAARLNARLRIPQPVTLRIGKSVLSGPYSEIPPTSPAYTGVMPARWLTWERSKLGGKLPLWKHLPALGRLGAHRVTNLAAATFLAHEAGHVLVKMLDLPITGREEDAVDGFAIALLLPDPDFGADAAIAIAGSLAPYIPLTPLGTMGFSDAHALPQQRIVQFLCWAYGSDPVRFASLRGKHLVPYPRALHCADEWRQLGRSWSRLLAPYAAPG
jgi:hypothetical protein